MAELTPASVRAGDALLARAPGYLPREQRYAGVPVFLWPADDEGYVEQVVYWEFTDGSLRMVRWAGPFTLTLDGELAQDNAIVAKAREVADEVQRVTGLAITIGPGGACLVQLGPDLGESVGRAELRFSGATIVGATLGFASRGEITGGRGSDWRNTLLHEMGHAIGLLHSPNDRDVMTPGAGPGTRVAHYQEHESAALHMMYYHRSAGNRLPDKDPQLAGATAATPRVTVIVD
ncbi:MAG TPA: matrixin family metalloprotease [Vicinamibacteria bacterium]|nr:matrixin family metalloprotease [Vicinamibacteria bacterium]